MAISSLRHLAISPPIIHSPSYLEGWFRSTLDFNELRKRVMAGELVNCSEAELALVLDFIEKNAVLHRAVQCLDMKFINELIKVGLNPNTLDEKGNSVLTMNGICPHSFKELWEKGFRYISPDSTILSRFIDGIGSVDHCRWENTFLEIAPHIPLEEYGKLYNDQLKNLCKALEGRPKLIEHFQMVVKELCIHRPEDMSRIAVIILGGSYYGRVEAFQVFLTLIKQKIIPNCVAEVVVCRLYRRCSVSLKNNTALKEVWKPEGELQAFVEAAKDMHIGLYYYAILQTKTLKEVFKLCSFLKETEKVDITSLPPNIKQQFAEHIASLQDKEKGLVQDVKLEDLVAMELFGFDPNREDPNQGRNWLFSSRVNYQSCNESHLKSSKINLSHLNHRGENALEYHCRSFTSKGSRAVLVSAGLKLSDSFPHVQVCRRMFPEETFLQVQLATLLLHPREYVFKILLRELLYEEQAKLKAALEDVEVKEIVGASKFSIAAIEKSVEDIPDEALALIPSAPLVSRVLSAIKKQHEMIKPKIIPIDKLFNCFTYEDSDLFIRYLFDHPEYMGYLAELYMKVEKLEIKSCGKPCSTHAQLVFNLMKNVKNVTSSCLPQETQKKLQESFKKVIAPTFKESLDIPEGSKISLLGRTVICESEDGTCDAYKFLRSNENYRHFAQESSVSAAFNELAALFESRFIKPIGVYAVRQLPSALETYRKEQPAYVFHYKAPKETFVYLQNVHQDQFTEARLRILRDGAKMIHSGIYPDSALLHNDEQKRGYVVFVDLLAKIVGRFAFNVDGGAGRLEQPFHKLLFPNQRLSGWTDLRDASITGKELAEKISDMKGVSAREDVNYFHQMHALSMLLFEDMLFLAQRWQETKDLQWQDEDKMKAFGKELLKAFATVSAAYSGQDVDKYTAFFESSGINWTRVACQIAFWLDTSETGYPSWVDREEVPPGLYEDATEVIVDVSGAENFTKDKGFESEGHQDIGPYNGPLGLTEYERALYLLFHPIAIAGSLS